MKPVLFTVLIAAVLFSCQKPTNTSTHVSNVSISTSNAMDSVHLSYNTLYHLAINTSQGPIDSANSVIFAPDSVIEYYDYLGTHIDSTTYHWSSSYSIFQPQEIYDYAHSYTMGNLFLKYAPLGNSLISDSFAFHNYLNADTLVINVGYPCNIHQHSEFFQPNQSDSQRVYLKIY